MKRRNACQAVVTAALAAAGLNYDALGGITYLSGTTFYTHTPVNGSGTGVTTTSDPSMPSSSNLATVGYTINGNASPLGGAGGQAGSSSAGSARAGFVANSTTASVALKSGTGISQTDPAGGTSYAFSQTRLDFKDATALRWEATSPGFGPTMTLYGSYTVAGSIGTGGFARAFVNLAFYRNSISGGNALGSIVLDTGTMTTAGAFNRTLTASVPAAVSSLTTGTNLLMIGTIQFQADNHEAPTEISLTDFTTGNSYSGDIATYVGPSTGSGWFASQSWQGNNSEFTSAPDSVGRRAYMPNDQGTNRTFGLSSAVTLGVLEVSGSALNTFNGSSLTLNNSNAAPSMIWLRGDYGDASLTLNSPIQAGDVTTELLNESKGTLTIAGGFATSQAGATIIKSGPGNLTLAGTINHSLSGGANYEFNGGTTNLNSDISAGSMTAFQSSIKVGTASAVARLNINQPQRLDQLTIRSQGRAVVNLPGSASVAVQALNISTTGLNARGLDVSNDGVAYRTTNATPLSDIGNLIALGHNGGTWTGKGISSSTAAADVAARTGLGFARVSALGSITLFLGQTVDSNDIVFRYTLYGDADLDGKVQLNDFTRLAAGFGAPGTWTDGDFNYDNTVNLNDFTALAANFGQVLPTDLPRAAAVPEPAAFIVLVATPLLLRRRARATLR